MLEEIKKKSEAALDLLYKRKDLRNKFRAVFGTEDGKAVLHEICRQGGIGKVAFSEKGPRETDFALGRQHLALSILRFMGMDEDNIINQIKKDAEDNE